MNQHDKMLRDALQALLDVQNGPPLFKTKDEWESAVEAGYEALATKPDQTQCPICEGDAVKQASYVCKKCGADFADAQCNRENIESWHRKPLVRLTDEGIDLVADNHKISILKIAKSESPKTIRDGVLELAHAIMDAMEEKNK